MNKVEYSQLQMLLAKLKFELAIKLCEIQDEELCEKIKNQIKNVDEVMKIFCINIKRKSGSNE